MMPSSPKASQFVRVAPGLDAPYPTPSSPGATAVGKGNRSQDTKPEVRLRSDLHRRGLRFRKNHPVHADGTRAHVDVCFTRARVAVFVDGCFWHGCPDHGTIPKSNRDYWAPKLQSNVERDRRVDAALTGEGWVVIRVWEHEDPAIAGGEVEAVVKDRRK